VVEEFFHQTRNHVLLKNFSTSGSSAVIKLGPLENLVAAIAEKREQELRQQRLAERLEHRTRLEQALTDTRLDSV
jgi:hypothetical protein